MQDKSKPFLFEVKKIGNPAIGYISIAEHLDLPFEIKRVYWTYFTPDEVIRGNHAHKQLQQILIAVTGQVEVEIISLHGERYTFQLNRPHLCLYLPSMCWRTLKFSHNAVLVCLASMHYEESDYIRDLNEFTSLSKNG